MFTFIPENLNVPVLLQSKPPHFKHNIDCFYFLLGQITAVAALHKDLIDERGWVPLYAPLLKHRIHNYVSYVKYLIENGIIECNGKYEPGKRSKGYRFTAEYRTSPVAPVNITKCTLLKSLRYKDNWTRNMEVKYDFLYRFFDDKLSIDYPGAMKTNEQLKLDGIEGDDGSAYIRYNANLANIIRLKVRDYYFTRDHTSGRIHTNLTSLKKELRNYVSYDGQVLASVDVVASQPFLLANILLRSNFTEKGSGGMICYYGIWASIRNELDLAEIQKHTLNLGADAEMFRQDCKVDFYTAFIERIKQAGIGMYLDREIMKEATYMILYSKNGYFSQDGALLKRVFKAIYPTVYALLEAYKVRTHKALPVLLQHVEAQVMLSGVARGLCKRKIDMPVYTLHDSIVLPATEIEFCKDVFAEEFSTWVGAIPPLKTKLWVPGE